METSTSPLRSASAVKLEPSTHQSRADRRAGSRQILDIIPRQKKRAREHLPRTLQARNFLSPNITRTPSHHCHQNNPSPTNNVTPPRPPPPRGGNPRHPLPPAARRHHHHPPSPPKLLHLLLPRRRNPPTRPPSRGTPRRHLPHRTTPPHRRVPRDHARAPPLSVLPPPPSSLPSLTPPRPIPQTRNPRIGPDPLDLRVHAPREHVARAAGAV